MKSKHTQKGNPYSLTIRQHIFPSLSIRRFCNEDGRVDMYMLNHKIRRYAKPDDKIFCVQRKWDEQTEKVYGKHIEDEFQKVANQILQNKRLALPSENRAITELYALWNLQYHWSNIPMNDMPIEGVRGLASGPITVDGKEQLEKNHITYLTNELSVPARNVCGLQMKMQICDFVESMASVKWGVLSASEGEFIVPDNFLERMIVPITPKVCLVANHDSGYLRAQDVDFINSLAISFAKKYIFARDLAVKVIKDRLIGIGIAI